MPAARYPSDRFDGTGGAAENEAIARIRGTGAGLIDQVISSSLRSRRAFGYYQRCLKLVRPAHGFTQSRVLTPRPQMLARRALHGALALLLVFGLGRMLRRYLKVDHSLRRLQCHRPTRVHGLSRRSCHVVNGIAASHPRPGRVATTQNGGSSCRGNDAA